MSTDQPSRNQKESHRRERGVLGVHASCVQGVGHPGTLESVRSQVSFMLLVRNPPKRFNLRDYTLWVIDPQAEEVYK